MPDEQKDLLYNIDVNIQNALDKVRQFIEYLAAMETVGKQGASGAEKAIDDIAKVLEKRLNIEKRVLDAMKQGERASKKSIDLNKEVANVHDEITKALSDQAKVAKDAAELDKIRQDRIKGRQAANRQFLREQAQEEQRLWRVVQLRAKEEAREDRARWQRVQQLSKEEASLRRQEEKEAAAAAKSRAALNRQYLQELNKRQQASIRVIKTFPQEAAQLRNLAHQYGAASVRIGDTAENMTDYERAVNAVIQRNPQLTAEIRKLSSGFNNFSLNLERGTFDNVFDRAGLSPFQLRQLAQGLDRLGLRGVSAFADIATTAGVAGIAIGGVVIGIGALVKAFIAVTKEAARFFTKVTKDSIEVAGKFDSIKASFVGVFEGNEDIALAVVDAIRQESIRLGVDVEEIVRKALPLVSSFRQLIGAGGISELAVGLAQLDPKQGQEGAVRVLQAALAGNLKPLKQTFDIDTTPILRAQEELGNVEGLLVGLGKVLQDRGLGFETLADTYGVAVGKITSRTRDLELVYGNPITAEKIEQINDLLDTINEGAPEIELVLASLGDAVAEIVESVGGGLNALFRNFNAEDARQIAIDLERAGVAMAAVVESITGQDHLRGLGILEKLIGFISREATGLAVASQGIGAVGDAIVAAISSESGSRAEAFRESIAQSRVEIGEWAREMLAADEKVDDLAESLDNTSEAALDQADAMVKLRDAQRQVEETADDAVAAQEKVTEAFQDAERDRQRDIQDMVRDHIRDVLDMEEEFSKKRAEIVQKYRDQIVDSRRKYEQDLEDAAIDGNRDELDIYRKNARDEADIEDEKSKKLLEIEDDYQRKLRDLRAKFLFEQREAILANDAVEYLRIQRRMEFELSQEREQNDDKRDDAIKAAEDKHQALQDKLQEELEDAKIANDRKLEDIRLAYARQIQENNLRLQREIRDQQQAEEIKRAETAKTYKRQQQDAEAASRRKLADMNRQYAEEFATIQKWEDAKLKLQLAYLQRAANIARKAASFLGGGRSGSGQQGSRGKGSDDLSAADIDALKKEASRAVEGSSLSDNEKDRILRRLTEMTASQLQGLINSLEKRAYGGPTWPGVDTMVGEHGPEVIRPMAPGYIAPTQMMYSPPGAYGSTVYNNQKTNHVDLSMLDPTTVSPAQRQVLRNLIVEVLLS